MCVCACVCAWIHAEHMKLVIHVFLRMVSVESKCHQSMHCKHTYQHLEIPPWWRHQMETFSPLLAFCAGNSPVTGEFPSRRPVTGSFDVFFDLHLNKRLSKQSRRQWFVTPSRSLWRHCNSFIWIQTSLIITQALNLRYVINIYMKLDKSRLRFSYFADKHEIYHCYNFSPSGSSSNYVTPLSSSIYHQNYEARWFYDQSCD